MRGSIHLVDYVVLVAYLVLMAGVGAYFMKFVRAGTDFLKGGNRIEWWVAGGGDPAELIERFGPGDRTELLKDVIARSSR